MTTKTDVQVAGLAAGFTLGFGFLAVWEAIKQTRRNQNPTRSAYIYMVWGELVANLALSIVVWLLLDEILKPTLPTFFFVIFIWVFEIQFLMQIIINRISVIAESRETVQRVKWGTALIITLINISVFSIFVPAHIVPPASQTFVTVNKYWDPISKVIILFVDAGLNWYFLRIVRVRLLSKHGLVKYKPLVAFNTKLMVVSVSMDALLIGFMFYPNKLAFLQFHPVVYTVKLNIEMSMASLIVRLAADPSPNGCGGGILPSSQGYYHSHHIRDGAGSSHNDDRRPKLFQDPSIELSMDKELKKIQGGAPGIHRGFDVEVWADPANSAPSNEGRSDDEQGWGSFGRVNDEVALTKGPRT